MPESLVDGMGRARFFHTVVDGSPVLVKTREGRPILVTPSPNGAGGRGLSPRHHAALMDLYDPDRARGPLSVRRGKGAPVASSWNAIAADAASRIQAAGPRAVLLTGHAGSPALTAAIAGLSRGRASGTCSGRRSRTTPPSRPGGRPSATRTSRGRGSTGPASSWALAPSSSTGRRRVTSATSPRGVPRIGARAAA